LEEKTDNLTHIKNRTIKGLFWSANSRFSVQAFNLIITAILARLLLPADFGTVGMSLIFIGLVSMINDIGLSSAIIQKKDLEDSHLHTAFWMNLFAGIFLVIFSFVVSPLIADFFSTAVVEPIIKVSSLSFLITSFALVQRSLLSRQLQFKKLALTEICSSFLSGIIAVYLAVSGFGLWSLVARNLINDIILVSLTLLIYPWKPSLCFSKKSFSDLFNFGFNIIGSSFLGYLRENLDYIIVGRFMGAELLGYYTLAYTLAVYPTKKIAPVLTRVIFPVFSRIKDDNVKLKKGYVKLILFLSVVIIPAFIGLAVVAPEFILVVYGPKWSYSIVPLQILSLSGIIGSIIPAAESVFYSKGVPEVNLKMNLIKLPITVFALIIGSFYGIVGIAAAVASTSFILSIVTQKIVNSMIYLSWEEYISAIKLPLTASLLMGTMVLISKYILYTLGNYTYLTVLIGSILVGSTIYIIFILKYGQYILYDIRNYR